METESAVLFWICGKEGFLVLGGDLLCSLGMISAKWRIVKELIIGKIRRKNSQAVNMARVYFC